MNLPSIQSKLERAWEFRFNQKHEEFLREFASLKQELPLLASREEETIQKALTSAEGDAYLSGFCLAASIDRWYGRAKEAQALLDTLSRGLSQIPLTAPAVLLLQQGLNRIAIGDTQKAMEFFLEASSQAKDSYELLCAEINLIQCLDNLGLAHATATKRVKGLLVENASKDLSGFRETFNQLKAREWLRHGEFDKFCLTVTTTVESQHDVLILWTRQLPYYRSCPPKNSREIIPFSVGLFQRHYRLRTLFGVCHPEDKENLKPSEWADRLYLWVWLWLTRPSEMPLAGVMETLTSLSLIHERSKLTAEDRLLVRNALHWLALFDTGVSPLVETVARRLLSGHALTAPLLDFEFGIIQYWMAKRAGNKKKSTQYLELLSKDPLAKSQQILLHRLFASKKSPPGSPSDLDTLRERLEEKTSDISTTEAPFLVNLSSYELVNSQSKKRIVSETLCIALDALQKSPRLRMDKFAFLVFGVTHYEPLNHDPRVYNLLARLKEMVAPFLKIRTKNGMILVEGDWQGIAFTRESLEELALNRSIEWRNFLHSGTSRTGADESESKDETPRAPLKPVVQRNEIETYIGKSRATTIRLLSKWKKNGWISRKGRARSTYYYLTPEFLNKLETGDIFV